jgi:hypothetical protein
LLLGNQQAGVIFAPPLPPLGTLVGGYPWPLSISEDAVLAYIPSSPHPARRATQTADFFPFDNIERIDASGKKIRVNGHMFLKVGTAAHATRVAETLRKLKQVKPSERTRIIEDTIKGSFDTESIEQRWAQFRQESAGLRIMTNVLFAYLFVMAPLLIWWFGLTATWIWLLTGLVGCSLTIAILFHRAHRMLYPSAQDERFTQFLIVLLSPASAIRANDLLTFPLLGSFHPLAISRVFCREAIFTDLAGDFLRELHFPALPLCPRPEPLAQATEAFARMLAISALEGFLRRNQFNPGDLLRPPLRAGQTSESFCPRCHAQFTAGVGICQDCGGVALVTFPSGAA